MCHGAESTRKDPRPEEQKMPKGEKHIYIYIQDSLSEGVIAIMNKEGDKRVYLCFWYTNSNMLAFGLLKHSPVSYTWYVIEGGDARKSSRNTDVVSHKYYCDESR